MMAPPGDPREIDATAMVELDVQPDSREAAPFVIPAATPALNGSEPQDTQARHAELFHELRELRTDVRDLQELLTSIRNGDVTLKTYAGYIQGATGEITNLLQQIHDGDAVQHLQNIWQQMRVCPLLTHPAGEFDAQAQLHYLTMLDAQCRKIIFQIGVLTIPSRLNDWLAKARPGYYVPFHLVFDDELPIYEDRVRVLNYLAWSPKVINGGLVDASNGLIYRYSRGVRAQVGSLLLLVGAFIVAIAIVIGACYLGQWFGLPAKDWPVRTTDWPRFLVGWAAVLTGIMVHVAVATAKRAQTQGGLPPVIATGDILRVISAKIGPLLLKLLLALVGFFMLVLGAGTDYVTPLNAFLIGYSLDSVVELFSANIEQRASAQVATLKKQLSIVAE